MGWIGPITLETFAGDLLAALSVAMLLTSRSQPCAPPGGIELAARVGEHCWHSSPVQSCNDDIALEQSDGLADAVAFSPCPLKPLEHARLVVSRVWRPHHTSIRNHLNVARRSLSGHLVTIQPRCRSALMAGSVRGLAWQGS